MTASRLHRERLGELLDLAQAYKGWSRKQLAKSLKRDAGSIIPDSGVPKLDLVVELATVLDWPVEDVVEALWSDETAGAGCAEIEPTFDALDAAAAAAHREGRYADMVELARTAWRVASDPEERVRARNREAGGWDGLGRFRRSLEAIRHGLQETGASPDRTLLLRSNLANGYYALWQLYEGRGIAGDVIRQLDAHPAATHPSRVALASACYVSGNCSRRLIDAEREAKEEHARAACEVLARSRDLYLELADLRQDDSYAGIANTCAGGILESEVALGRRGAGSALDEIGGALDALVDTSTHPLGDRLESYGWWCIFGCNIALRHVKDERELQRAMAVLTNKADEIAERLGNWSMRERVCTLEYARRVRFSDWSGLDPDWTIDHDDVRVIAGAMGRFPVFQQTGWRILRTARIIRDA